MERISPQDALQHLGGKKSVKVYLPTKGTGSLPFEGVAMPVAATLIKVNFLPDFVPNNIDQDGEFKLSIQVAGPTVALHGVVKQIVNDRQLVLEVTDAYEHPQKREHFRIDLDLPVRYWRHAEDEDGRPEIFQSPSERVNLSGGGIFFVAEFNPVVGQQLGLELSIPGPPRTVVRCLGRVVRSTPRGEKLWGVALHFTDIEDEDQEEVISYCFAEQRRQLRTKVDVVGR